MGRTSDANERLVEAAGELWHSRSYGDVGVNEICEHAGVQKGSFYHFFPSKRDLALAVIDSHWQVFEGKMVGPILNSDDPPLDRLVALGEMQYRFTAMMKDESGSVSGCAFGNLAVEMSTRDEVLRERLDRVFEDWAKLFGRALDEAVEAGDLPQIDTKVTARAIQAYIEGMIVLAKTSNDPEVMRELSPGILRLAGIPAPLGSEADKVAA